MGATLQRCLMVCLNINGVGLDILLHIVTDASINIRWAPNGFNRSDGATGEKAALSVDWCGAWREERERMVSRVLGVFDDVFSALLSQRAAWRWCQPDASGAQRSWCSRCPLRIFYMCWREKKDGSSRSWGKKCEENDSNVLLCFSLLPLVQSCAYKNYSFSTSMESRFSPAHSAILLCSARLCSYMDKRDAWRGRFS